ncbi:MAG TPA: hypothetical protein PLQ97_05275 [Myxococcota bacterium]|nr:hypothetical protein [Myxococcota bacterium]HQK52192.1 hypothetical protein [Myxococcota bacterium]
MAESSRVEWSGRQGPPCWVGIELPPGAAQRMLGAVRRLVAAMGPDAARWCWVDPKDWWIPLWVMPPGTPPDRAADAVRCVAQDLSAFSLSLGPWSRWPGDRLVVPAGPPEGIRPFQEALGTALDRQGFDGDVVEQPGLVVAWASGAREATWEPPAEREESGPPRGFTVRTMGVLSGDLPPASFRPVRTVELRRNSPGTGTVTESSWSTSRNNE